MAELTDVSFWDLYTCDGCCCAVTSLFCEIPECFGGKAEGIFCCFQAGGACCRCMVPNKDQKCSICFEGGSHCVEPSPCIQGQYRCSCFDMRAGLPCTPEVPCICSPCPFLVLFCDWETKVAPCVRGSWLIQDDVEEAGAPAQEEMK